MGETRKPEGRPDASGGIVGGPVASIVALFVLVAALSWTGAEAPPAAVVRIENRAAEARAVDVVWIAAGGRASGSLLRVVEPAGTMIHPVRIGAVACVRWIDGGSASVEAAWPVPAGIGSRTIPLPTEPARAGSPDPCPPELLEHRVRPRPGRWMPPGQPGREYRERVIPRAPRRRIARRRRSKGRGRGLGEAVYARRLTRRFGRCPWSH